MTLSALRFARTFLLLLPLALSAACAEGLSNAPAINRPWTPEDFQHDAVSNGPESCPKESAAQDPLAPAGERRRRCPEPEPPPAPAAPTPAPSTP
jgi:hypothetical protein